jgi:hypothetical protein
MLLFPSLPPCSFLIWRVGPDQIKGNSFEESSRDCEPKQNSDRRSSGTASSSVPLSLSCLICRSCQAGGHGDKIKLDEATNRIKLLERQREELIDAFRKQMKLIDVLKRQKVRREGSSRLSHSLNRIVDSHRGRTFAAIHRRGVPEDVGLGGVAH